MISPIVWYGLGVAAVTGIGIVIFETMQGQSASANNPALPPPPPASGGGGTTPGYTAPGGGGTSPGTAPSSGGGSSGDGSDDTGEGDAVAQQQTSDDSDSSWWDPSSWFSGAVAHSGQIPLQGDPAMLMIRQRLAAAAGDTDAMEGVAGYGPDDMILENAGQYPGAQQGYPLAGYRGRNFGTEIPLMHHR